MMNDLSSQYGEKSHFTLSFPTRVWKIWSDAQLGETDSYSSAFAENFQVGFLGLPS